MRRRDVSAVDSDPDLLVRDSAHVVGLRRVEGVEPELGSLAVPSFEHRLRDRAVREPLEPGPVQRTQPRERFVGGRADRDVVGMPEDAVGAERDDNSGILLLEDPRDRRDHVIEGDIRDASVRQTQPLVTVRNATERTPRGLIFGLADGPQRFAGGREPVSDVPLLAERGVNQDEPEVRLIGVQRDTAGGPVRVVVRMREDAGEGPVTRNPQYRPKTSLQQRGGHDDQRPHLHTARPARRQDCHGPGRRANPCLLARQHAANICPGR